MKMGLFQSLLFIHLLLLSAVAVRAAETYPANSLPTDPQADGLLVKFKPHINPQQIREIAASYGASEVLLLSSPKQAEPPMAQWRHLKFAPGADLPQIMQRMAQDKSVATVELNGVVSIQQQLMQ